MVSLLTVMFLIFASWSIIAVFIPCLHDQLSVINNNFAYHGQLIRWKAVISAQFDGFEPKLTNHSFSLDMYMLWLHAIETVKEKAVRNLNIFYRRHRAVLPIPFM